MVTRSMGGAWIVVLGAWVVVTRSMGGAWVVVLGAWVVVLGAWEEHG